MRFYDFFRILAKTSKNPKNCKILNSALCEVLCAQLKNHEDFDDTVVTLGYLQNWGFPSLRHWKVWKSRKSGFFPSFRGYEKVLKSWKIEVLCQILGYILNNILLGKIEHSCFLSSSDTPLIFWNGGATNALSEKRPGGSKRTLISLLRFLKGPIPIWHTPYFLECQKIRVF